MSLIGDVIGVTKALLRLSDTEDDIKQLEEDIEKLEAGIALSHDCLRSDVAQIKTLITTLPCSKGRG